MTGRNSIHIFIFAIAVAMVLFRPYAAYRISMRPDTAGDPVKVNNLLQRLIKKKDEHHAVSDEHLEAIFPVRIAKSLLPFILLFSFLNVFAFAAVTLKQYKGIFNTFKICPQHKYYLSILCIRL